MASAGIEVGKIKMPQTLIHYLLSKSTDEKPSQTKLFGMLMQHQKFNVGFASNRCRIKFPKSSKFKKEPKEPKEPKPTKA
jgi:hypothetical protein